VEEDYVMTNEELDRAIAEHLGWSNLRVIEPHQRFKSQPVAIAGTPPPESLDRSVIVPRYSTDLNALREAVASLTELEMFRYADEVCDLAYDGHHDADIQMILKMEARPLAECYVRAIGKWRGE
jgi:hypothetical protein